MLLLDLPDLCFYFVCIAIILQKGTYDAEKKIIKLKSELVGNASKVFLIAHYTKNPLNSFLTRQPLSFFDLKHE